MSAIESRTSSSFFHLPSPCVGASASAASISLPQLALLIRRHHVVAGLDELRVLFGREAGLALLVAEDPALALGDALLAVLARRERVAPVTEGAFRELHDVALVHEGDALALLRERVVDRRAREPLRAFRRDGLDADAARVREADLLDAHLLLEEADDLLRVGRAGGPLDAGVDVLRVLAEDHHVHELGALHGRRNAGEVAHRAQADVEVEHAGAAPRSGCGCRRRSAW